MSLAKDLQKQLPEQLKIREYVSAAHVGFQQQIITFLLWAYGFLLVATTIMFFLQGFHVAGFNLDAALLKWLGGATIGEISGLLVLTIRASFR
jgi:hypothetical protein